MKYKIWKYKIWLMILISLILFVLVGQVINEVNREEIQKLIIQQNGNCKLLKDENKKLSLFLDKILSNLNKEQKLYQEVKKIRAIAKEAEELILKSEKRLEEISQEENEEILLQNFSEINDNLQKAHLIHRFISNLLQAIFAPLFEKEVPKETII